MASKAKVHALRLPDRIRCAIYTRKSTEEGLDQDFNSLDAQREAAESYIRSQQAAGWVPLPERYDDGGFTGANLERPAFKRLLADIAGGKIDCVVVYKLDRLTRSMRDFFKILEVLEEHGVSFVLVTQQFNTSTPIGRLALNVLMSFAQFERENTSDRTRDKMRAARRKGKFIGGNLILGYDVAPKGGALVVNEAESEQVLEIFRLYLKLGSLIPVIEALDQRGCTMKRWTTRDGRTRGGSSFTKTTLHNLLTNVTYTGRVKFEGKVFEGEHTRIINDELFNRVQEHLKRAGRSGRRVRNKHGGLLKGILRCANCGAGMTHTYSRKGQILYRYYVCNTSHQRGCGMCETGSVSATLLEGAVIAKIRGFAQSPEMLSELLQRVEQHRRDTGETAITNPAHLREMLAKFEPLWDQLRMAEQERYIRALVAEVRYDGATETVTVGFHSEGIQRLCELPESAND
jgi:site-specific DNA recombinase